MITKYIFGFIIVIASLIVIFNLNHYFNNVIEKREIKSNIMTITDTLNFICAKNIPIYHFKIPYLKNINYNITFKDNILCAKQENYTFCQRINCDFLTKTLINKKKNSFNIFNCKTILNKNIINISCKSSFN